MQGITSQTSFAIETPGINLKRWHQQVKDSVLRVGLSRLRNALRGVFQARTATAREIYTPARAISNAKPV